MTLHTRKPFIKGAPLYLYMDPSIGRIAFNIGVLLIFLTLIPLPFLDPNSAEFIVDIIAFIVSIAFLLFISYEVRRQVKVSKEVEEREEGE